MKMKRKTGDPTSMPSEAIAKIELKAFPELAKVKFFKLAKQLIAIMKKL